MKRAIPANSRSFINSGPEDTGGERGAGASFRSCTCRRVGSLATIGLELNHPVSDEMAPAFVSTPPASKRSAPYASYTAR
jgi:hypothetical protein